MIYEQGVQLNRQQKANSTLSLMLITLNFPLLKKKKGEFEGRGNKYLSDQLMVGLNMLMFGE